MGPLGVAIPLPRRAARKRFAQIAQLVEQGTENPRVAGSIQIGGTISCVFFAKNTHPAAVAHLVERHLAKVEVAGSSPVIRSIKSVQLMYWFFYFCNFSV